jgi:hypothetical protein
MTQVNRQQAEKRIALLRERIRRHDHLYYVQGAASRPAPDSRP